MSYTVSLELTPHPTDIQTLRAGLRAYNRAQAPELLHLWEMTCAVVAHADDGTILGGAVAEDDWGWLYVDTLWVDANQRGQDYGTRIMTLVEQTAYTAGFVGIFLMTADFQALGFYQKLGYRILGQCPNRPAGHMTYYLVKQPLIAAPIDFRLHLQIPPNPAALWTLDSALRQSSPVPIVNEHFAVFLRDSDSNIVGGLVGGVFWDWLDLRWFWLADAVRGKGYGAQILAMAEAECQRRGVYGIIADTASFQSLPFYQKHGFDILFTLHDRPPGYESYFIRKLLR
jgi:GNAT superfamily N-acetyltransferase